jgi:hypothetical protein
MKISAFIDSVGCANIVRPNLTWNACYWSQLYGIPRFISFPRLHGADVSTPVEHPEFPPLEGLETNLMRSRAGVRLCTYSEVGTVLLFKCSRIEQQ